MDSSVWYAVETPRSSELVTWLEFNGVSPRDVAYPAQVFIGTADGVEWFVQYRSYARTKSGAVKHDARTDRFQYVDLRAPMAYDPPMWWLRDAASNTGASEAASAPARATCSDAGGEQTVADGAFNCD